MKNNFESLASSGEIWGLYIHWPYCASICPYCDFNRKVKRDLSNNAWKEAVIADLRYMAAVEMTQNKSRILASVFFGGGTPSLSSPDHIAEILAEIKQLWNCSPTWEVTLEANPTSAEIEKFQHFAASGINRLSLGIQSLRDDMLQYLGRNYQSATAKTAIHAAQKAFARVNLDMIYARKADDDPQAWLAELNEICAYDVSHLSLYQLTLEIGTAFYQEAKAGTLQIPSDDKAASLFQLTRERLAQSHYNAYEISNFAKKNEASRHNLIYWHYGFYGGIGAGAHGRVGTSKEKYATARPKSPTSWAKLTQNKHASRPLPQALKPKMRFSEKLMMGLRLYDGIQLQDLQKENNEAYTQLLSSKILQELVETGYMKILAKRISASDKGILCLNSVLNRLLN